MPSKIEHKYNKENIELKICSKCDNWKSLDNFQNYSRSWDKLLGKCKECKKIERNKYREYNISYGKTYRPKHTEKTKKYDKKRYQEKYTEIREKQKHYNLKPESRIKNSKRHKKWRENGLNKLIHNQRTRISKLLRGERKYNKTIDLIGCSVEFLKDYLEKQFITCMTWENYGKWHVDHIKPCASFDLTTEEAQRKCFHYTNLQPLWAKDNLSKGSKWEEEKCEIIVETYKDVEITYIIYE